MSEPKAQLRGSLLLVSYWFPPAVGAAAERVGAFAKYLPQCGWDCHVLTAQHGPQTFDHPGVTVHAVRDPRARRGSPFADYDPRAKPSRLKQWIRDYTMLDRFGKWANLAKSEAMRIVDEAKPDAILVSFPPASAVFVAEMIRLVTKVPCLIDFRDTWLGPGGYQPRRSVAQRRHRELQALAISRCRAVIAVSTAMAEEIVAEHGLDREKVIVIPNGYDEAEEGIPDTLLPVPKTKPFVFAHVGTVIPRNRPDMLFDSISRMLERDELKPQDVRFRFVGNLSQTYLRETGLSPLVETTGLVQREHAQRAMYEATALLLLTGDYVGRYGYNAKVFEYIRTGRAIVCLEETPGSNDRNLLERFAPERSFFAKLGDDAALLRALRDCRRYVETNGARASSPAAQPADANGLPEGFDAFHRRNQTAILARHLEKLGITPGVKRLLG